MFNFARLKLKKQAKQIIVMSFLNRQRIKDVVAQPFVYDKEGRMRIILPDFQTGTQMAA